jgi:hypothetical protein
MRPYRSPEEQNTLLYIIAVVLVLVVVVATLANVIVPGMMESVNEISAA